MTTSIDIYSKVTDYIEHNINLKELESWLVSMLPTYLLNPNSGAYELGSEEAIGTASTTETTNLAWTNPSPSWSSVPQVANV